MAFKTGTICSKHDKIKELANEIQDLADKCLDDGGRMESGLTEKNRRIETLEEENEGLKAQLERAESLIESLQQENQDLADQLKSATTEAAP